LIYGNNRYFSCPPVSYPKAVKGKEREATFSFYVGAIVTFGDGTVCHYGLDQEMQTEDYGGSTN
jgi:hypothetical protein